MEYIGIHKITGKEIYKFKDKHYCLEGEDFIKLEELPIEYKEIRELLHKEGIELIVEDSKKKTLEISSPLPCQIEYHLKDTDGTLLESKVFETRFTEDVEEMKTWLNKIKEKYNLGNEE